MNGSRYLTLLIFVFICCCSHGPNVSIYVSIPSKNGLVRSQNQELVTYASALDWLCSPPDDAEALFNYCLSPKADRPTEGPAIKIYAIKENGLVRSQNNELLKFENSQGYICMNHSDYEAYLNWCLN